MLNAALPGILHPYGTEHLSRQIARGIKSPGFFLEMYSLQLQRVNSPDRLIVGLARHPAESLVRAAIGQHHVVVVAGDARDERDRGGKILNFGGDGKRGIHQHRHRQLVARPVENHSAFGRQRNGALLLMSRLLDELAVTENLQKHQPPADHDAP